MYLRIKTLLSVLTLAVLVIVAAPRAQVMAGGGGVTSPGCGALFGVGGLSGSLNLVDQFWAGDVISLSNAVVNNSTGWWVNFEVSKIGGGLQSNSGASPWTASISINEYAVYAVNVYNYQSNPLTAGSISCTSFGAPPPAGTVFADVYIPWNPGDTRINHSDFDRGAPVAVYCPDNGIRVIRIDHATSEGTDQLDVSAADIEAAGVPESGHTILAKTEWVIVSRLANGDFQVNAWYIDAKPYTISWQDCNINSIAYLQH